ncbi:MAG: VTT domain-containing protein [bacterium]|nr:VTT domain-containing protein [bacterium]MDZ4285711.1 VTT domain-containing protein [Candidatus Sungbacteria bacterium]
MESLLGFDINTIIQTTGLLGVFAVVFAESGLFFGFFLPGDSLLFTAGFLASQGVFPIVFLMVGCTAAAIFGDNVGYAFGNSVGKKIFTRDHSFFFRKHHLEHAKNFYEKYGAKTIVMSRFLPVIRSFAPIVAGAVDMDYRTFLYYNVVGGVLWALGLTGLGYALGSLIPNVDHYLLPLIGAIIIISFLPPVIHILIERRKKHRERA